MAVAYSFNVTGSAPKAKTTFELTTLSPDEFKLSVKPENVKKYCTNEWEGWRCEGRTCNATDSKNDECLSLYNA